MYSATHPVQSRGPIKGRAHTGTRRLQLSERRDPPTGGLLKAQCVGQDGRGCLFLFSASGPEGLVLRTNEQQTASLCLPPFREQQSSGMLTSLSGVGFLHGERKREEAWAQQVPEGTELAASKGTLGECGPRVVQGPAHPDQNVFPCTKEPPRRVDQGQSALCRGRRQKVIFPTQKCGNSSTLREEDCLTSP